MVSRNGDMPGGPGSRRASPGSLCRVRHQHLNVEWRSEQLILAQKPAPMRHLNGRSLLVAARLQTHVTEQTIDTQPWHGCTQRRAMLAANSTCSAVQALAAHQRSQRRGPRRAGASAPPEAGLAAKARRRCPLERSKLSPARAITLLVHGVGPSPSPRARKVDDTARTHSKTRL